MEVALEDGDPDTITIVNDAQFSPAISGLLTASHEGPAEQITHTEARDNRPIRHTRRRSLIWRLFEQLDSLDAARCRICTKRLHVSGGISNLRRHLSKRHPKVLSELLASGKQPPADPHHSNADGVLDESFLGSEQRQGPGKLIGHFCLTDNKQFCSGAAHSVICSYITEADIVHDSWTKCVTKPFFSLSNC